MNLDDIQGWKVTKLMESRGHAASMCTLSQEEHAKRAPKVSFVHDFPGFVKTGIARGTSGPFWMVAKAVTTFVGPLFYIHPKESGERHLYLATSARFPALKTTEKSLDGSQHTAEATAKGTDGKLGSGVYTVDQNCDSGGSNVDEVLSQLRKDGVGAKLWADTEEQWSRITGTLSV